MLNSNLSNKVLKYGSVYVDAIAEVRTIHVDISDLKLSEADYVVMLSLYNGNGAWTFMSYGYFDATTTGFNIAYYTNQIIPNVTSQGTIAYTVLGK